MELDGGYCKLSAKMLQSPRLMDHKRRFGMSCSVMKLQFKPEVGPSTEGGTVEFASEVCPFVA